MDRSRRPVFLNLMQIQMPVGALTSIGHRISGVVLSASVPVAVYLFALSLRDEVGFAQVTAVFGQFWEAEAEHQEYLEHLPNGYTCHFIRPDWKLPARAK